MHYFLRGVGRLQYPEVLQHYGCGQEGKIERTLEQLPLNFIQVSRFEPQVAMRIYGINVHSLNSPEYWLCCAIIQVLRAMAKEVKPR